MMNTDIHSLTWSKRISLSFFIIVLLFMLWKVSYWLLADFEISKAINQLESWNQNEAAQSFEEWQNTLHTVEQAIELNPDESEYYRLLGLSYEWQGFALSSTKSTTLSEEQQLKIYQQALDPYREAVALQPSWPQAWVQLARIKALANELDDEFKNALLSAIKLGGNDPNIQFEISQLALMGWALVAEDPALELPVLTNFHRGLSNNGNVRAHIRLLNNAEILGQFCKYLNTDAMAEQAQQACNKAI